VKRVIVAFRAACHTGDDGQMDEETPSNMPFRVLDSGVFNRLMMFCLRNMHRIFDELLQRNDKTPEYVTIS